MNFFSKKNKDEKLEIDGITVVLHHKDRPDVVHNHSLISYYLRLVNWYFIAAILAAALSAGWFICYISDWSYTKPGSKESRTNEMKEKIMQQYKEKYGDNWKEELKKQYGR